MIWVFWGFWGLEMGMGMRAVYCSVWTYTIDEVNEHDVLRPLRYLKMQGRKFYGA